MPDVVEIVVTPEHELAGVVARSAPERVVSFGSPDRPPERIAGPFAWEAMLFHDIPEPRDGLVAAAPEQVAHLARLGKAWTGERPLVLQCWMGISRSTAAAIVVACARGVPPEAAARALRAVAPEATPNPHVIRLADDHLALDGRLVAAVERIGRGCEASVGRAFSWELER